MRICWFVTYFAHADAISNQGVALQRATEALGYDSTLFTPEAVETRGVITQAIASYTPQPDDVRVVHYGARSHVEDWLLSLPGRTILYYHNVTPARFFERVGFQWSNSLQRARDSLTELAHLDAITDSEYNRRELLRAGFRNVHVQPLFLDLEGFAHARDNSRREITAMRYRTARSVNWLHVGRIAPNKRIEDIVKAFYVYHSQFNPDSHLFLIGADDESEVYSQSLKRWIEQLSMQEGITFTGKINQTALYDYYTLADLYVCMSEHEGFCLPLVEAMVSQLPVLAFRSSAVTETMGEAGLLVDTKNPLLIAEVANLLLSSPSLLGRVLESQIDQARRWHPDNASRILQSWLKSLQCSTSVTLN